MLHSVEMGIVTWLLVTDSCNCIHVGFFENIFVEMELFQRLFLLFIFIFLCDTAILSLVKTMFKKTTESMINDC